MVRSPEQMVFAAREAAQALHGRVCRGGLVARFVDGYAAAFERRGLQSSPLRYKELLSTITREALVAAAARLFALLPAKITRRKKALLKGPEAEAVETFRGAFLGGLGELMKWMPGEREGFRDDLDLYARMEARRPRNAGSGRPKYPTEGAFVDRCALLLDPSLLEKAREAAGKFQVELEAQAEEALDSVFQKPRRSARR
jgi:hypothetical protein